MMNHLFAIFSNPVPSSFVFQYVNLIVLCMLFASYCIYCYIIFHKQVRKKQDKNGISPKRDYIFIACLQVDGGSHKISFKKMYEKCLKKIVFPQVTFDFLNFPPKIHEKRNFLRYFSVQVQGSRWISTVPIAQKYTVTSHPSSLFFLAYTVRRKKCG